MKTKTGLMGLMAVMLVAGCDHAETPGRRAIRLHAEAPAVLAAAITNGVVGWTRTITSSVFDEGDNPHGWTGSATVEFVNTNGGVERSEVYFGFSQFAGKVRCSTIDAAAYQARLGGKFK